MVVENVNSESQDFREMTVANIRDEPECDHIDVVFLESARFYRLNRSNPDFHKALHMLREASRKQGMVRVGLESPHSDVIHEIHE